MEEIDLLFYEIIFLDCVILDVMVYYKFFDLKVDDVLIGVM